MKLNTGMARTASLLLLAWACVVMVVVGASCRGQLPGDIAPAAPLAAAPEPTPLPTGNVTGCEHVAFVRISVPGGLVGPARQCAPGDRRDLRCCVAPDGALWIADSQDCIVYRIKAGQARIVAGCGIKGFRDGPADRAMFDFGVGAYNDVEVNTDAAGNIYVSDMMNNRIRKIFKKPDGTWWVETVSGGGKTQRDPEVDEWIPAPELKFAGASRFAVAVDGTIFYANYGGVYEIRNGVGRKLIDDKALAAAGITRIADWHVGGSHITSDGIFYWIPGGQEFYRLNIDTRKVEVFAGRGPKRADGATPLESGFHTVVAVYNPDASVIFTGGGDEIALRRIYAGKVEHLQPDGSFKAQEGDRGAWRLNQPVCLDRQGRLYTFPGSYAWSGWLCRVHFAKD